ncbi:MAG TPA: hypothetical protein VIM60_04190, partial [Edaphobacter sp.]
MNYRRKTVGKRALEKNLPGLTIPVMYRRGISRIGELSENEFERLVKAFKSTPSADTADLLAAQVEPAVPSIPREYVKEIAAAISSMKGVQKSAHVSATKFSLDVWEALEVDSPELAEPLDANIFIRRLEILIEETDLFLTSVKVKELRSEVERSLYAVRILTDLRAVFGEDTSQRPALTPIHTLEIKYHHETGEHREFYVCLD